MRSARANQPVEDHAGAIRVAARALARVRARSAAIRPRRLCSGCPARARKIGASGDWCIGNTVVSKTATPGSIPGSPAAHKRDRIAGFAGSYDGFGVERVARKCPVRHAGSAGVPCARGRRLSSRDFGDPRRRVGALQISVDQGSPARGQQPHPRCSRSGTHNRPGGRRRRGPRKVDDRRSRCIGRSGEAHSRPEVARILKSKGIRGQLAYQRRTGGEAGARAWEAGQAARARGE